MKVQLKRGSSDHQNIYTPDVGEPVYITDTNQIRIGDGKTPGGVLAMGNVKLIMGNESLPKVPTGIRQKIIRWLGGIAEYGFVYDIDINILYGYCHVTERWVVLNDKQFIIANDLESIVNVNGMLEGMNVRPKTGGMVS